MKTRAVWVWVLLLSTLAAGQTFRGSIQGTVTDASGAAVPEAQITVTNAGTGLTRTAATDSEGNYIITELPIGEYAVTVGKIGFATRSIRGVQVGVATISRVDAALAPGEAQETVEVTAEVPLVQNTLTTVGGTIEGAQAVELPVNGRDFTKLLVMVPGAVGDPGGANDSPGSFGLFSINGNRGRANNYLLDGTDMNDGYRNLPSINEAGVFGTPATVLPVDALAEIPVMNNVEAEYGRNAGAIVNLVTKSGTNNLHGTVYGYFRNDAFDARNFFNPEPDPKNEFSNYQWGGSLGGPIVKDRTFFFVAYEHQDEEGSQPSIFTMPTQAEIAAAGGVTNPVIANLLALDPWGVPLPATDGNIVTSVGFSNRVDSLIGKIDHHFSDRDILTGRYFFGDSDQSFPLALVGGSVVPGYNTVTPTTVNILSLSYTHIFSPKWLMEVRGGWNRFAETFFPEDQGFDPGTIGLNTVDDPMNFGLPAIQIGGYSQIGATSSVPRGRVDTNTQLGGNLSYKTGSHNYKFGAEYRRTFVNGFFNAGYRGALAFETLDDFVAGNVTGFSRQTKGPSDRHTFQNNFGLYFQDNWKLHPQFTFNYGLRWDYYGVIGEENDLFSILDPAVGLRMVEELYPKDWNNFGPRLGFAWDPFGDGKTVVRAGWGVYFDAFSQDFFVGQLPWPTFNAGPAYNGIGPAPVLISYSPIGTLDPTMPVFPDADFFDTEAWTVDQNIATPYVQNYNLNVQHQFNNHVAVQVGYVGSSGRKLFRYRDINQVDPALGARPFDGGPFAPSGNAFGYVLQFESSSSSNYNGLQTSLRIRNWRGLTSTLNYVWSHSLDNASDGQDFVPNAAQPDNSFDPHAEWANSNFDVRQRLVWLFNWDMPWKGNRLVEGWGFDGVLTLMSGQPINISYLFEDDFNGSGEFFGRPDLVGNPFTGTSTPGGYLNLSAFAVPCTWDPVAGACVPGTQHFGSLGRNALNGPSYQNFDFSIVKNTSLTERVNLQLRLDFFNLFNHPNFANPMVPNFAIDFLQNGIDDQGRGVGFLPITATPDVALGNPSLGGGGPRNIQLGVRLRF